MTRTASEPGSLLAEVFHYKRTVEGFRPIELSSSPSSSWSSWSLEATRLDAVEGLSNSGEASKASVFAAFSACGNFKTVFLLSWFRAHARKHLCLQRFWPHALQCFRRFPMHALGPYKHHGTAQNPRLYSAFCPKMIRATMCLTMFLMFSNVCA